MAKLFMNLDWSVLNWIHRTFSCDALDFLMPKFTLLGNNAAPWITAGIAMLCVKKYRRFGIALFCGLIVGHLMGNYLLKTVVSRPRPCDLNPAATLLIENPDDYSFPSGHALSSAIAATILTLANRRFGYTAIPLALLIAFSRLYLYVHFPSDVLCGLILGIAIGEAAFRIAKRIPAGRARKPG